MRKENQEKEQDEVKQTIKKEDRSNSKSKEDTEGGHKRKEKDRQKQG